MGGRAVKLGFLYAGQGSQHPGMGADLYEAFPAFRGVLDAAQAEVDFDLKRTCFEDLEGVLNQTRYTQPCMVAFAAGLTAVLRERGIVPSAAATGRRWRRPRFWRRRRARSAACP